MSMTLAFVASSSGIFWDETLCGNPSSTTSIPAAASAGSMPSKTRSVALSSEGCAAPSGSPTKSTEATLTSSTSGWMSRRRIISAPPYPEPPMTAAL